jgi:Na+-transporting NADH:ubiquinone oxidoreductase subunit C
VIDKIKMIGFVLVFGVFWSSALVAVDTWTGPKIEKYLREKTQKKVLEALVISYEVETLQEVFQKNVTAEELDGKTIYRAEDGSVAIEFLGAGSQGAISGIVALGPSLDTIKGITIIKHSETPGLGSRVLDAKYLANFQDKKIVPELLIVPAGRASADNEVDAITGATLTGDALERILNDSAKQTTALIGQ